MRVINRTAHCSNCGGVLFKIKPGIGCILYYCADCDRELLRVDCDGYENYPVACECGGDKFKVSIIADEKNSSRIYWDARCVKCKTSPKSFCVDNEGKIIKEEEWALLITKERILELEEEISAKKETINKLENQVSNLSSKIEKKDNRICDLEIKLDNANSHILKLNLQVSDLEWEIGKIGG